MIFLWGAQQLFSNQLQSRYALPIFAVEHRRQRISAAIGAIKERSDAIRTISIRFTLKQSNLRILALHNRQPTTDNW